MEAIQKFHNLLKGIFQFEASDLDFGIYRVLNYKRQQIKDFIENTLPKKIEEAFKKHKDEKKANIDEKFEDIKNKINETLGKDAITTSGELKNEFKNTPLGKEFITIKAQKEEVEKIDEIKLQVFNDLYSFFSRYYEEGDFVPQYRYSIKGHKYAIPYNGEEVKLYWANSEQYYTKTGLLFRDYTFKAGNCKVIFRIIEAKEELSSNKATKERFFVLDDENPIEVKDGEIIIRFQYRELTEKEVKDYQIEGGSNTSKQEKINQKSFEFIKTHLEVGKHLELIKYLVNEIKNEKPNLLYHLNRFSAKNTKDYFIHKNLKRFLTEQLDYFIKSEVLDIETLSQEKYLDKHITRAKTVKEIGEAIIEFLSQIEDFQKRLWEKKKFVLKTEYVITTDRIYSARYSEQSEESLNYFYEEILKNNEQKKEWEELGFEIPKTLNELKTKKLPIDTKYFNQEFKERLLEKLTENADLDNLLDGLLIKSENWQALNTILEKYKEKVQTIYIDPPFNKEQDADYLYNVKYKDSTWLSMLENRLRLARELLNGRGSIFVRCDYNGNWLVRPLMNEIFGEENFRNEIILRKTAYLAKREVNNLEQETESLMNFCKNQDKVLFERIWIERKPEWVSMQEKPNRGQTGKPIIIEGQVFNPRKGYCWARGNEVANRMYKEGRLRIQDGKLYILLDKKAPGTNWTDIVGYINNWKFQTENSEPLLKRVIESTSNEGDLVMDFFLGSGTTTAVAQKLKRKWIGVEMGEHFWTVVLPRMKKVLAYDKSGISKEKDVKEKYNEKTAGGFFKYQIIEQYEDTLDNIELKENQKALKLFKDEYLLKYFLDFETRESPYFLNIEHLKNPFAYKLKVNLSEVGEPQEMMIDIPETFNYLLGIKVKKIKKRIKDSRPYLFVLGEKESKDYAIVWREYSDSWDEKKFREDRDFVRDELKEWKPQIVYINGQSVLTQDFGDFHAEIRVIEPDFKRLMES